MITDFQYYETFRFFQKLPPEVPGEVFQDAQKMFSQDPLQFSFGSITAFYKAPDCLLELWR